MYSSGLNLVGVFCVLVVCLIYQGRVQGECESLQVSGSIYYPDANGIYYLDENNRCNSRHIWIHESGNHYLYYVSDGYNGWTIGPWSCHWGNFAINVKSTQEEPYEVSEIWKEYEDRTQVWENNSAIQIRCFDDFLYKNEHCPTEPCQNGASCNVKNNGSLWCFCQHGYYGRFCEVAIDTNHCKSFPCMNNAICSDLQNDFECKCTPGFSGRLCDIVTDEIDCATWICDDRCADRKEAACHSHKTTYTVLVVVGLIGGILVLIATICLLRFCCCTTKSLKYDLDTSSRNKRDMSYKRLDPSDSASSLNKVEV